MNDTIGPFKIEVNPPSLSRRIYSVWTRHYRVYVKNIFSNGFPPFVEPLFFLAGIGLGLGNYVGMIDGVSYASFLASGLLVSTAMFTASFECTFGTFIRLEFDKVYDGMLSSSISIYDMLIGEILFAGSKSIFFTAAVLFVISIFGLVRSPMAMLTPFVGFFTGLMFASFSLFITAYVKTINHFSFYFSGLLTPMFFFSGIFFPLTNLPKYLQNIAEIFPLTHSVNIVRALCFNKFEYRLIFDGGYIMLFILIFTCLAVWRLKKRIIF